MTRLTRSDAIRLNPITIILERCAEVLYRHPVVQQYVSLKFRQDLISAGILANFVLSSVFILALNLFAFSIPPPAHFFQNSNSTDQEEFCPGIGQKFSPHSSNKLHYALIKIVQIKKDLQCRASRIALFILLALQMVSELKFEIHASNSRARYSAAPLMFPEVPSKFWKHRGHS